LRATLLATLFLLTSSAALAEPGNCPALAKVALPGATTTSELIPAGTVAEGVRLPPGAAAHVPAFCRVRITDRPTPDSDIRTEIWLPAKNWNGKYRGQGNGGFAGIIDYSDMAAAVAEGYATAGTDTGHAGSDPVFALHHPEKIKDFGWRAVHDMTVQAKTLTAAFYGSLPQHSYFASCSDGGREALIEAQRFPNDYDGILAGAPAYPWTALMTAAAMGVKATLGRPENYLPPEKIPVLAAAVRAACDAADGVQDGVVNDPRACHFDPATIQCKSPDGMQDAPNCLTPGQVASVNIIYATKRDNAGHEFLPGAMPGGEEGPNGWTTWITGDTPGNASGVYYANGFFRDFVYQDPTWSVEHFDATRDLAAARAKTAADLDAYNPNLKAFLGRGGRLILYHGWNDPAIPALSTVAYFEALHKTMGDAAVDSAVRLYLVPGMQHCGGGPGATHFGQAGTDHRGDAQHDVFTALEQWVEASKAPGALTAERLSGGERKKSVEFTRPLCPYPAQPKYHGGNTADASSFACVVPGH